MEPRPHVRSVALEPAATGILVAADQSLGSAEHPACSIRPAECPSRSRDRKPASKKTPVAIPEAEVVARRPGGTSNPREVAPALRLYEGRPAVKYVSDSPCSPLCLWWSGVFCVRVSPAGHRRSAEWAWMGKTSGGLASWSGLGGGAHVSIASSWRTRRHWEAGCGGAIPKGPSGGQTKSGASRSGRVEGLVGA